MLDFLKKLFLKTEENEPTALPSTPVPMSSEQEERIEFNVREIVSSHEAVLLRIKNKSPLILCRDMEGSVQKAINGQTEEYKIIEINTKENPGPFNIFAGLCKEDLRTYERFLAPQMEQAVLSDLSRVLLHSILLAMIESQDLSWKKFTALMSSVKREKPEYVVTAIDDEIVQAFNSFKDLTKNPDKILVEFDKYKKPEYWNATQGIVQDNERTIIFFRNYSDPTLNKFLEYRLKNV